MNYFFISVLNWLTNIREYFNIIFQKQGLFIFYNGIILYSIVHHKNIDYTANVPYAGEDTLGLVGHLAIFAINNYDLDKLLFTQTTAIWSYLPNVEFFFIFSIFLIFCMVLYKTTNNNYLMQLNTIYLSLLLLFYTFFLLCNSPITFDLDYFLDTFYHFHNTQLHLFIKKAISFIIFILFLFMINYNKNTFLITYEFVVVLLVSVWSMFLLISTFDLIGIYLLLELQSFCFYLLTSSKNKSNFATEAGLKYFILGSLSSGLLLFGISLLYGITGLTNLSELRLLFSDFPTIFLYDNILLLALILIVISLLFKLGLAPFHMYIPDVYSGAPTIVTLLFLVIQKLIIFTLFFNVYEHIFVNFFTFINYFLIISLIFSIVLGSITALFQYKFKRLIAYSAIVNSGFLMIGLITGTVEGIAAGLLFLFIYINLIFVLFGIYLSLNKYSDNDNFNNFSDFLLLKKSNLLLALCFSFALFSLAGIPPLSGFYGKLFLFMILIKEQMFIIGIISILFTVITTYYYIKLIKIMFFENNSKFIFLKPMTKTESYIISLGTMLNLLFFCFPKLITIYINYIILYTIY